MKKECKVYSESQVVDYIFNDNLIEEFESVFGVIPEGSNFKDFIVTKQITLNKMIDFLNRYDDEYYYVVV